MIRQLYHIKQSWSVHEYIDKFSELVDHLNVYNSRVDPLFYSTKFIDGLRVDIHSVIVVGGARGYTIN
jgi:hypothetical protein